MIPLFVCDANCSRSMMAAYLFRDIAKVPALSAGIEVGERPAARAVEMLAYWGIDAGAHRPRQIDRAVCDHVGAIFVMAAPYLRRLLIEYGEDLGVKSCLFADPFTRPVGFANHEYAVNDPTWDTRAASDLCAEYAWMRGRVAKINEALHGRGRPLVPAASYLDILTGSIRKTTDLPAVLRTPRLLPDGFDPDRPGLVPTLPRFTNMRSTDGGRESRGDDP